MSAIERLHCTLILILDLLIVMLNTNVLPHILCSYCIALYDACICIIIVIPESSKPACVCALSNDGSSGHSS